MKKLWFEVHSRSRIVSMKDIHLDYCVELKVTLSQIIQYTVKYCKNKMGAEGTTNFNFVKKITR
jgi:hypothetical protein